MKEVLLIVLFFYSVVFAVDTNKVLQKLLEGNKRFSQGKTECVSLYEKERLKIFAVHKPLAVIVSCSDARVNPELIFDTMPGDLFVTRTAGETVDSLVLGSIEFAVTQLGVKVVIVIGHKDCGAVKAALDYVSGSLNQTPNYVHVLLEKIIPAVTVQENDTMEKAIKANVLYQRKSLHRSAVLDDLIKNNKVKVFNAYFNFDTGLVEIFK